MKLKLAYYVMSRAKHLFQPEAKAYDRVASLIRHRSLRAAARCARIGRNNDIQLHKSLKEFLAFFCVVTLNELALKSRQHLNEELKGSYRKLIQAVCEGPETDARMIREQLTVSRIITYKKSGFDHWFYGYWNADFEGMRITKRDLQDLHDKGIQLASGSASADAGLILLIRLARLESPDSSLPAATAIGDYDRIIREEVMDFVRSVKAMLQ